MLSYKLMQNCIIQFTWPTWRAWAIKRGHFFKCVWSLIINKTYTLTYCSWHIALYPQLKKCPRSTNCMQHVVRYMNHVTIISTIGYQSSFFRLHHADKYIVLQSELMPWTTVLGTDNLCKFHNCAELLYEILHHCYQYYWGKCKR